MANPNKHDTLPADPAPEAPVPGAKPRPSTSEPEGLDDLARDGDAVTRKQPAKPGDSR